MIRYRAIVSIEFDDEDLQNFADRIGYEDMDASDAIGGELDNMGIGTAWIEQLFRNGRPTIHRMGGDGIQVTINEHDLDGSEDDLDDEDDFDDDDEE